jgi:hypothetical protein
MCNIPVQPVEKEGHEDQPTPEGRRRGPDLPGCDASGRSSQAASPELPDRSLQRRHSYLAQARHQVLPVIAALLPLGKKRLRESYRLTGVR